MSEHRYLHSDEKYDEELGRLKLQESIIDPNTIHHFKTIGVSEGWRCLEVGAGAGSMAQWLSRCVWPSGKVVATDINTRFLDRISAANLEIRRHNILDDDIEGGHYDLAHCRLVLGHLPEPVKALRRMTDALRPGGWLLVEEWDAGSALSTDVTDSSAAPFTAALRAMWDYLREKGIADPYLGRRLRGLVEQLGFVEVGHDGWVLMARGGDSYSRDAVATLPTMFARGVLTQEQCQILQHHLLDSSFNWIGPVMFDAWGRKPVQGGGT